MAAATVGVCLADGYALLAAAFAVLGLALGFLEALANPLTAELDPPRAAWNLNVLNAYFPVGLVVGALAGGEAMQAGMDWRWPLLVLCVPVVIGAVGYQRARFPHHDPQNPKHTNAAALAKSPLFWLLGLAMALTAGVEGGITFWGAKFIQDQFDAPVRSGAMGIAVFAVWMAAGRFATARIVRTVRLEWVVIVAALLGIGGIAGLIKGKTVAVNWVSLAVCGLAVAPFWPTLLAIAERRVRAASTTLVFALLATFGIGGYAVFPWLIGKLADVRGLGDSFACMAAALGVVVVITAGVMGGPRRA